MRRTALSLILSCCQVIANSQDAAVPRRDDPRQGWHFYEDPAAPVPARIEQRRDVARPEITRYKALQKAVEEARIVAVMTPTIDNVRAYLELEASVLQGASRFADVSRRVAWMSPQLDPSAQTRPSATFAVNVFDQQMALRHRELLGALGRDHVVLFFFRSDCPYCHAFAPVLNDFQKRYGIRIEPVSTDGGALPEFPAPRRDNGISQTLNVKQVPALFLAHPESGKITPLGFGVLSENELVERIVTTASGQSDVQAAALLR